MSLITWSWIFLFGYMSLMVGIGIYAQRQIQHADDFATARGAYGPVFLALAFAASTASGATFLGSPAMSYEWGLSTLWMHFLYPVGVYVGILISMRLVATSGNRFGNRSIPEYLGDRYQSDTMRLMVSLISLVLFFYLAGQLVSGVVMFEIMLGLDSMWALGITTFILLIYVVLGGAHADILTDGVQGFMMLLLAVLVIILTALGWGVEGGFSGIVDNLAKQDQDLVSPTNPNTPLFHSWWSIFVIAFAHMPLGLLPHLGNKLWALDTSSSRLQFVKLAAIFGLTLGLLGVGGLLARVYFGDALYDAGANPNQALPLLFIELFPHLVSCIDRCGCSVCRDEHGGRLGGLVITNHCQRPVPQNPGSKTASGHAPRTAGPSGVVDQPVGYRRRTADLYAHGMVADGCERFSRGLDRRRRHDGGLRRTTGLGCFVVWGHLERRVCRPVGRLWRLHRPAFPNIGAQLVLCCRPRGCGDLASR